MKKKILLLVVQLGLCSAIFFAVALFVFSLRSRKSNSFIMPNLLHKNYLNMHNELQKLGLRVKISHREYQDLPTGMILAQSTAAGSLVRVQDSLRLVVNQPNPFLVMPNLLDLSLAHANSIVQRLPSAGRVYSLKIVSVGRLETEKYPHNTIISQFPPQGKLIGLEDKIYLLVASRAIKKTKKKEQSSYASDPAYKLIGQNITVAAQYFHHKGLDYRIRKLALPLHSRTLGQIYNVAKTKAGLYLLDVYYQKTPERYHSGYERLEVSLDEGQGKCRVEQRSLADKPIHKPQLLFATQKYKKDETVQLVFYRQGAVQVQAHCGDERVYKKKIYPEI